MERSLADALNERAVQHWTGLGIYPTAATATRWAFFLFYLFDIWNWFPSLQRSSKRRKVCSSQHPNGGCASTSCMEQIICTDSWWFHVYCTPSSYISLTVLHHHPFLLLFLSLGWGFSLAIACVETAEQNHSVFSSLFALGEHSNSLYGWRPLQIRQHAGECVMLDRQPGESQVGTWQVIKSQLCPCIRGSALGQMETVTVEV